MDDKIPKTLELSRVLRIINEPSVTAAANLDKGHIHEVVLVGGSTRIPKV
jgi:molecular chaperone DnaK (HSP70)